MKSKLRFISLALLTKGHTVEHTSCCTVFLCYKDVGFYQDKSLGAAIMVTCVKEEHTPCARTLVGTVHLLYLIYIKQMLKVNMLQTKKTESC